MNKKLNPHYDFDFADNQACRAEVLAYDNAYKSGDTKTLQEAERKALKGADGYAVGVNVESPWGDNKVLSAEHQDGVDIVIKEITVKPGFMLSLQRHRGRAELWEVKSGTLTVISDGQRIEVPAGESIELPKGNVHCMNNVHAEPVTVIETQTGFCRESDNVRLLDFNNRPTIPLETVIEAKSAALYVEMHNEIKDKFGCKTEPLNILLSDDYKTYLD